MEQGSPESVFRGVLATVLAIAHNRLALLATEVEEEKLRLLDTLLWGVVAVLLGGIGLAFFAVFITVLFWDTHRLLVLGLLTIGLAMGCVAALWRVRVLVRSRDGFLSASLAELEADRAACMPSSGGGGTKGPGEAA